MKYHTPITDSDLQAYVDQQLAPQRRREVEDYLAQNPEAAKQVEQLLQLNTAVHKLYDPILNEPLPADMAINTRSPWAKQLAAAVALVFVGGLMGWWLKPPTAQTGNAQVYKQLVRPAAFAHQVYATDRRRPVELKAKDEQRLIAWLSQRMHTRIQAPNLVNQGFELIGGRLLPSTNRMAAQFMYQNASGRRLTLYIRRGVWSNTTTIFRYSRNRDIGTLYWIDGPMGYALSGGFDKATLLRLSDYVYRQIHRRTSL